jgi:hypothetical protein
MRVATRDGRTVSREVDRDFRYGMIPRPAVSIQRCRPARLRQARRVGRRHTPYNFATSLLLGAQWGGLSGRVALLLTLHGKRPV